MTRNRSKKFEDESPGPWTRWRTKDPAERAIRFIETYCRPPKGYNYGKPLKLGEFQKEFIRKILQPGINAAILGIPRGNGKSTLLAGLAVWAVFDVSDSGEAQVPVVATTVSQAKKAVYDVAVKMILADEELSTRCKVYTAIGDSRVEVASGGVLFPVANDPDGLQGLDPSFAVVDEIGFQPVETWTSLIMATGKRKSSIVVGIGTPGLDRDNALWLMRERYLQGDVPKGFVFQEFAAPDGCLPDDEDAWLTANPALAEGFINVESIRNNLKLAPESHFRLFHLGQWVDGTDAWLGADGRKLWDSLKVPSRKLVSGEKTWVGLDVGLKRDSTALVLGQVVDGIPHFEAKLWFPTEGDVVDPSDIMQAIRELDKKYDLVEVAYDPRLFEYPALLLGDEGIPMIEFPQSIDRMTPAFGALYEAIHNQEISHNGDQAFAAQILNGIPRYNERGFTLAKAKARGKIDAAYALAMCFARLQQPVKPKPSLYVGWAA